MFLDWLATMVSLIIKSLEVLHRSPEWVFFAELRLGTGWGTKWEQRIDAWALNCYPSRGLQSVAYEIKVARSDFLRELKKPDKRQAALSVSNWFYFVAPVGVIKLDEVPGDCGLYEFEDGVLQKVCEPPFRDREPLQWRFLASLGRRILESS
jgi:hypothetical protein